MSHITEVLESAAAGDPRATAELLPLVYDELRSLAAQKMAREALGNTLQPTALVHEVWLRLGADAPAHWQNRAHFFAAAAEAMRRILVDRARRRQAQRRGSGLEHVDLDEGEIVTPMDDERLLALHEALERFVAQDSTKAELVKLRYFAGLTLSQAAQVMNVSEATAKRWWTYARAWLFAELKSVRE
ncbi:MAG TPA: RNA polymerase subunit sigma [Verrucomicrobiales bacterium]|nr:RNA polymerase subunit sigma [Verrucomicrobiales bacterium]